MSFKQSQYLPDKSKKKVDSKGKETHKNQESVTPYSASAWDVIRIPWDGFIHGIFGTGVKNLEQLEMYHNRQRYGLPDYKKKRYFRNPFRKIRASSWFSSYISKH